MRALVLVCVVSSACRFSPPEVGDDGGGSFKDGGLDSTMPDGSNPEAGCVSFSSQSDTCVETFGGI